MRRVAPFHTASTADVEGENLLEHPPFGIVTGADGRDFS